MIGRLFLYKVRCRRCRLRTSLYLKRKVRGWSYSAADWSRSAVVKKLAQWFRSEGMCVFYEKSKEIETINDNLWILSPKNEYGHTHHILILVENSPHGCGESNETCTITYSICSRSFLYQQLPLADWIKSWRIAPKNQVDSWTYGIAELASAVLSGLSQFLVPDIISASHVSGTVARVYVHKVGYLLIENNKRKKFVRHVLRDEGCPPCSVAVRWQSKRFLDRFGTFQSHPDWPYILEELALL